MRPLTIANPREKVVQKAIEMVLQQLFEPQFLDTSHGFRPNRGCHTALQMVEQTFRGGKWIIEADLTKCFDTIPHDKLMQVLSQRIHCVKTLTLINSALKAGHIYMGETHKGGTVGTPQGSILSPLLCNIYLHQLDLLMQELSTKYTVGATRRKNPAYRRIQYLMSKIKGTLTKTEDPAVKAEETRNLAKMRRDLWKVPSKDPMDPEGILHTPSVC